MYPYKDIWKCSSNICDSVTGGLRMLCNGYILYDTVGNIIENGDTLVNTKLYNSNCCPSSGIYTQGSIILPKGSNNQYYLFNVSVMIPCSPIGILTHLAMVGFLLTILQYHVVDMNANAGMGVNTKEENNFGKSRVKYNRYDGLQIRHMIKEDWWLLKQGANANTVYFW
ncbi:MAG: hypothetical protein IPI22_07160 [Bacteroidetes bacterium]|nr:hypothetical protein [Bacteroidota bacterium]